jgi:predicted PurR-regulated permease PerM
MEIEEQLTGDHDGFADPPLTPATSASSPRASSAGSSSASSSPSSSGDTDPNRAAAASAGEVRIFLRVVVAAIVVGALYVAQDVLIPITLAIMLSFVLSPLVNLLQRVGLWRVPAVAVSVLVALGVFGLLGTLIGSQAAALTADAPRYAQTIEQKVQGVQALTAERISAITLALRGAAVSRPATTGRPSGASAGVVAPQNSKPAIAADGSPRPVLVEIAPSETSALVVARTIVAPILAPLETTVIVIIVAIFILLQREDLRDRFIRLVGSNDLHRTTLAMDDAGQRLSRYFLSQLGVNATFGLVIGLGVYLIGLPSPVLWGVIAALLRFVPYIGAMLAAVPPLALSAAIDPGWSLTLYTAMLFVIVEPLTGYVVEPLLYGHSTGLSPLSVIIAAIFWTWMWGPIGLILSTPLTLCLVVMGRHVESMKFFDVLLGDQPALSEATRFYQRAIADDPDEALDQAEKMLNERSLLDYYDSVVLPALRLAADDHASGRMTQERSIEMARSILSVVKDLEGREDAHEDHRAKEDRRAQQSGAQQSGLQQSDGRQALVVGRVACVAGRGPFDEAVSAMLAQLLVQRGVATTLVPYAAVSRESIAQLDLRGVNLMALSYLDLEGSPAHLRYLTRRLHQHASGVPILVGLWKEGDDVLGDAESQKAIAAEAFVTSLREAIDATLTVLKTLAARH